MQSERRISFPRTNDVRRKSTNTNEVPQNDVNRSELNRFDSFGKVKPVDMQNGEPVNWQNQSFGDSEDNKIFESKRIIDVNREGSESENDAQNFSFCESETKTQPRRSDIVNQDTDNRHNFDIDVNDDLNLFGDTVQDDRLNIEQMLKRPTAVIVPSYIDAGKLISYS